MHLCFDIETDGLLPTLTKLHCIVAMDVDTKEMRSFGPEQIETGVAYLQTASTLTGHNSLQFDIPAIKKIYPDFSTDGMKLLDTLVMSRLIHSDLKADDYNQGWTHERMPQRFFGSHSLKAWGMRLGEYKDDFDPGDWSTWSPAMQEYCEQDVVVLHRLYEALAAEGWPQQSLDFEHRIAEICYEIGNNGWNFDQRSAGELYAQLALERSTLEDELTVLFPPWTVSEEFVPKVNNATRGYKKGEVFLKQKEITFNPNSRRHIEHCLREKYGWKPTVFTPSGEAKVDESILSKLKYPEAQKLARIFMLQKRIGQLAEGKQAWLRLVDSDGKLRHSINPNGTVSGRCSSHHPNMQQVPSVRAEYGKECRELFRPAQGYKLVGVDLASLELRCLAHYLDDGGEFAKEVVNGDIHQSNADKMGVSRDVSKVCAYAITYGAGDARLGAIIGKGPRDGKALREAFFKANPAFARLLRQVKQVANSRGYLIGLDGRRLPIRSEHGAINILLQSAGALIAKKWAELVHDEIQNQNVDAKILAFCHDELQIQTKGDPDYVGDHIACRMARKSGEEWGFKCPIDAEYRVGSSWAECH